MRSILRLALLGAVACQQVYAQAAVETLWNCRDKDGRTILTNQQQDTVGKECRVVQQQRVTVVPSSKPGAAKSSANFPKESASDRLNAKDRQRQTLERELQQEETMLADARRKLAEQEQIRTGDEKNYARVLERLQPYKDAIEVHGKNIEALKRELANLYR
jgi:hypothetical protein